MGRFTQTYLPALLTTTLTALGAGALLASQPRHLIDTLGASHALAGSVLGLAATAAAAFTPYLKRFAERLGAARYLLWTSATLALAAVCGGILDNPGLYLAPALAYVLLAPSNLLVLYDAMSEELRFARSQQALLRGLVLAAPAGLAAGAALTRALEKTGGAHMLAGAAFLAAALIATRLPSRRSAGAYHRPLRLAALLGGALEQPVRPLATTAVIGGGFVAAGALAAPLVFGAAGLVGFGVGAALGVLASKRLVEKNPGRSVLIAALLPAGIAGVLFAVGGAASFFAALVLGGAWSVGAAGVGSVAVEMVGRQRARDVLLALACFVLVGWAAAPVLSGALLEAGLPARAVIVVAGAGLLALYERLRRVWGYERWWPRLSWRRRQKIAW